MDPPLKGSSRLLAAEAAPTRDWDNVMGNAERMESGLVTSYAGIGRLRLFFALSRTPHGLLDICTPLLAALLWLGRPPEGGVLFLGVLAAFAGYTAVYALNDLVDYRVDREKIRQAGFHRQTDYLDGAIRHPLARGLLTLPEAVIWTAGWGTISLVAAWLLNPVCALILIGGCLLEAIYCLLLRVSQLRTLVSGVVKTLGGLAAVFAVDRSPDPAFLLLLFLWLFFWEIGGQNVPADWHDIEEDAVLRARTIPVLYGPRGASLIVLFTLITSMILNGWFLLQAPVDLAIPALLAVLLAGLYLLLLPALRLFVSRGREEASSLFNRASYYPLALLIIVILDLLLSLAGAVYPPAVH